MDLNPTLPSPLECISVCPHCERTNEVLLSLERSDSDIRPQVRNLLLCVGCAGWGVITEDWTLRKLEDSEMFAYSLSRDYTKMSRVQVLVKLRNRFGSIPDEIMSVRVGADGEVKEMIPLPPEALDLFL